MFYCFSKMNVRPKTETVESVEKLLDLFVQNFQIQSIATLSARAVAIGGNQVELRIEEGGEKAIFEVIPRLSPSRKLLQTPVAGSGKKPGLLLFPHLPEALAADLRAEGINHADLNGRLFFKTPWFLMDRQPAGGGYRNPGSELNPFTLKSSRTVRLLLAHRAQEWTQAELETRTGVSRALVSVTLADLIKRELVVQTRPGNRHVAALYRVNDFDRLLDAWRAEDSWSKWTSIRQYSVLAGSLAEVAETVQAALGGDNVFFTQWFAAHLRHPYTTPPLVSAYLKKPLPNEVTWARKVDNGGNLWLIAPKDEGVFQAAQPVNGYNLVSDVQIYLDLLLVGQRGPEQAQALRAWEGFAQ